MFVHDEKFRLRKYRYIVCYVRCQCHPRPAKHCDDAETNTRRNMTTTKWEWVWGWLRLYEKREPELRSEIEAYENDLFNYFSLVSISVIYWPYTAQRSSATFHISFAFNHCELVSFHRWLFGDPVDNKESCVPRDGNYNKHVQTNDNEIVLLLIFGWNVLGVYVCSRAAKP